MKNHLLAFLKKLSLFTLALVLFFLLLYVAKFYSEFFSPIFGATFLGLIAVEVAIILTGLFGSVCFLIFYLVFEFIIWSELSFRIRRLTRKHNKSFKDFQRLSYLLSFKSAILKLQLEKISGRMSIVDNFLRTEILECQKRLSNVSEESDKLFIRLWHENN